MLLLLTMVLCMASHAQITNKIWGLTLGISTKQQVVNVISKHQLKIRDRGADYITCSPTVFDFGGESWNYAKFYFFDGKLLTVSFSYTSSLLSVRESFDRLKASLDSKHFQYITSQDLSTYGDWYIDYDDGTTMLSLTYNIENGYDFVGIMYSDLKLMRKKINRSQSEL